MKKLHIISLLSLLTPAAHIAGVHDTHITLESPVLKLFDGTAFGINADIIELIGLVRREINTMLVGNKTKNESYVGIYTYEGKQYTITELAALEQDTRSLGNTHRSRTIHELLDQVKKEFIAKVEPFMERARSTKHQMLILIEESTNKRNKKDNFLLKWADAPEGHEEAVFLKEIKSFTALVAFAQDLLDFLGDLVRSCPKGRAQFVERVQKCNKIHTLMPKSIPQLDSEGQKAFMHYLKDKHVDKLDINDITQDKIATLFSSFSRNEDV
ncbi:MAG TPA: hypothetical protein PLU71_04935 [Candidatus Dependentiae bacterium]|nr:hypothetical protein [Candidatus Dependentiae bacterium]HRQ63180.1 hypothetical protein [Candidatus Dependentiae bacterium]